MMNELSFNFFSAPGLADNSASKARVSTFNFASFCKCTRFALSAVHGHVESEVRRWLVVSVKLAIFEKVNCFG